MRQQTSESFRPAPWYFSNTVLLAAMVVLPPVGLALLWMRPRPAAAVAGKLVFSVVPVGMTLLYMALLGVLHVELSGAGWRPIFSFHDPASDQDALARHRAQQAALAAPAAAPAATAVDRPAPKAAARAYWIDFRGPKRDGGYSETTLLTSWPAEGLQPMWRQPIGGG